MVAVDVAVSTPDVRRGVAEHLNRIVDQLRIQGVRTVAQLQFSHRDHIADHLASAANQWGADLIVLGSHRRGDLRSLFVGSVGHALARGTRTPLLFVGSEGATHRHELPPPDRRSVLVAVDHDQRSQQAVDTAIAISGPGTTSSVWTPFRVRP